MTNESVLPTKRQEEPKKENGVKGYLKRLLRGYFPSRKDFDYGIVGPSTFVGKIFVESKVVGDHPPTTMWSVFWTFVGTFTGKY